MKLSTITFLALILFVSSGFSQQPHSKIALTFDDPNVVEQPILNPQERASNILATLKNHHLQAALFVCGLRVSSAAGDSIVQKWNNAGHLICNHSWSHWYYPAKKLPILTFYTDILRCDSLIRKYNGYTKLFRFPYLKEGSTIEKRDSMQLLLQQLGYSNGYVSIDASDWYVDQRMIDSLKVNPKTDLTPFRDYYLAHIVNRAKYYDSLAHIIKLSSSLKPIFHTLLLHHTLLNALFLDDLIKALESAGFEFTNVSEAYGSNKIDAVANTLPAGESIIYALTKERSPSTPLRYPGEDEEYESEPMTRFLLNYKAHKTN